MSSRDGGPAFPHIGSDERVGIWISEQGLSKREYIAIRLLPSILTDFRGLSDFEVCELLGIEYSVPGFDCSKKAEIARYRRLCADTAYQIASEMLAAHARALQSDRLALAPPSETIKHPAPPLEDGDLPEVES